MLKLLAKLFIHDSENCSDPRVRTAYGTLCGIYGICLNLVLFSGKVTVGFLSGAISIIADAFNNLSDATSSIVSVIGFKLSNHKPDIEHPFGHGRIEYLAGLVVAAVIVMMGWNLVWESFGRILHPSETEFSAVLVIVLVLSVVVKLYMAYYNRTIGKKINSQPLLATAIDSLSDSVATSVVLICAVISHFFKINLDGFAGVAVGVFILFAGFKAAKETISPLLGKSPDPEFIKAVENIVKSSDKVVGMHDLIVHDYGPGRLMISLHAEVPGDGDIFELHDEIDLLEYRLMDELHCHAVIHMDPVEVGNPRVDALKALVKDAIGSVLPEASFHDFRAAVGPTHNNLIFDVLVPMNCKLKDEEISSLVQKAVSARDEKCFVRITVDRDYTNTVK